MRWFWKKTVPVADLYKADELFAKAADLYNKKLYAEALPYLQQILVSVPEYAPAHSLKGFIQFEFESFEDAVKSFNEALHLKANYAEAYRGRGMAHAKLGNFDAAIEDTTQAIKRVAGYPTSYGIRAYCWSMKGQWDKVIEDAVRALHLNPERDDCYIYISNAYLQKGNLERAVGIYDEVVRRYPQNGNIYFRRGCLYYSQLGNNDLALEDFSKAVKYGVKSFELFYILSRVLYSIGNYEQALIHINNALQIDPQIVEPYGLRSAIHRKMQNFENALEDCETAIQLNRVYGLNLRGTFYSRMNNFEVAMQDYNEALQLDARYYSSLVNRAEVHFVEERYSDALKDWQSAYEIEKNDPFSLAGLCITHHVLGNMEEAERFWKLLLEFNRQFQDIDYLARRLGWLDPLVDEARKVAQKFAE